MNRALAVQNVTRTAMAGRRERAAQLLAEDRLTDAEIAAQVGVRRKTLAAWKHDPAFAARLDEHRHALAAAVLAQGIADRRNRVEALNRRWQALQQVIAERAADPSMATVPGGTTGLLVHHIKVLGFGEYAQTVDEYEVDTGLLRELRAHEEQAARELGQWTERQQTVSEVVVREYVGIAVEDV